MNYNNLVFSIPFKAMIEIEKIVTNFIKFLSSEEKNYLPNFQIDESILKIKKFSYINIQFNSFFNTTQTKSVPIRKHITHTD